ncbi:MAG: hypothetical protein RLN76_01160 [Phycisphaeraceae bacterium]
MKPPPAFVKNRWVLHCSKGDPALSERERLMLNSYGAMMEKLCHELDTEAYQAFKAEEEKLRSVGVRGRINKFRDCGSMRANLQNLIFRLSTDPALARALNDGLRCPDHKTKWFGVPGRLRESGAHRMPSPFYACRFITKKLQHDDRPTLGPDGKPSVFDTSGKVGWLSRRNPTVSGVTMDHQTIELTENETLEDLVETGIERVRACMSRLKHRFRKLERILMKTWLVGGYVGWDVAIRMKTSRSPASLKFHIHLVGEPYEDESEKWQHPPQEMHAAWRKSAEGDEHTSMTPYDKITAVREDTIERLLYAGGLYKLEDEKSASHYPKFMRGFDPQQNCNPWGKNRRSVQRPDLRQLYLLHAAYMTQPGRWPRCIGGWEHRTKIGRQIKDIAGKRSNQLRQNDSTLREFA